MIGNTLGPYRVLDKLGEGGMGEVYSAHDTRLDRGVAIKVISGLAAGDPDLRQRFEREARTVSQLNHPHICALYDIGHEVPSNGGTPGAAAVDFLVMELVEGETLALRLSRGPLPIDQALQVAVQVADALAAAHRRGIVHRDLKPANIMLTKSGAKLLDFGLAKTIAPVVPPGGSVLPTTPAGLTAQGTILGTFQYMAPEQLEGGFALSPDGQQLAFIGHSEGRAQLYLRALDRAEAVVLAGDVPLSNTAAPAFSPDGRWIVFTGAGRVWKVSTGGGAAIPIAATAASGRPAWGGNDTVVFENTTRTLSRVHATGGEVVASTQLAEGELQHTAPWLTADGRTLLFVIRRNESDMERGQQLVAQSIEGGERRVLADGFAPVYLESGQLLFERQGIVYAAGFNPTRLSLTSDPAPVLSGITTSLGGSLFNVSAMYAASQNGSIAFVSGRDRGIGTGVLTFVDERGTATAVSLPARRYADPRLSPDGRRVAVHIVEEGRDNFVADLERGTLMRLTTDPGEDETPVWTPDGQWIVYTSTRADHARAIFRRRADGSTGEELLWSGKGHVHLGGFTPDGRTLVLAIMEESNFNLATLSLDDRQMRPLVTDQFNKTEPALSPDGRWLAYVSDETGRPEVYVQAFPTLGARYPISTSRGREPVWSRDGRQLFYRGSGKLMAVDVAVGESFSASVPRPVFDDRFLSTMGDTHTNYDIARDGRRFLMVERAGGSVGVPTHIDVVLGLLSRSR